MIDPRSYYFMHEYLHQAKRDGKPIAIISTWVKNLD